VLEEVTFTPSTISVVAAPVAVKVFELEDQIGLSGNTFVVANPAVIE
jgi:hypothetical protein